MRYMSTSAGRTQLGQRRLQKELAALQNNGCPTGCAIVKADDLVTWFISMEVLGESVYKGEKFLLRFRFDQGHQGYPMEAPEVPFDLHACPTAILRPCSTDAIRRLGRMEGPSAPARLFKRPHLHEPSSRGLESSSQCRIPLPQHTEHACQLQGEGVAARQRPIRQARPDQPEGYKMGLSRRYRIA